MNKKYFYYILLLLLIIFLSNNISLNFSHIFFLTLFLIYILIEHRANKKKIYFLNEEFDNLLNSLKIFNDVNVLSINVAKQNIKDFLLIYERSKYSNNVANNYDIMLDLEKSILNNLNATIFSLKDETLKMKLELGIKEIKKSLNNYKDQIKQINLDNEKNIDNNYKYITNEKIKESNFFNEFEKY